MATVSVVLSKIRDYPEGNVKRPPLPVVQAITFKTGNREVITSSGTSTVSTISAPDRDAIWVITPKDGDIWVNFGDSGIAASVGDFLIKSGTSREFAATEGQFVAVLDAP